MNSYGIEKGMTIRQPSTANLMVDSADRPNPDNTNPYDFQITRNQSIMNGFFTRVGTTEVVLEWCQNNVDTTPLTFDISGVNHTITIVAGHYTVSDVLDSIVSQLDALALPAYNFSVETSSGQVVIYTGNPNLDIEYIPNVPLTSLEYRLDLIPSVNAPEISILCPDLRPHRYIDFICPNLTYAQDLKDSSTQSKNYDVLCRWYFSDDTPDQLDVYGFPILMGYTRFCRRRIFNPPKQIKWDSNLPLGNIAFQVLDENGDVLTIPDEPNRNSWLMTLQMSEN